MPGPQRLFLSLVLAGESVGIREVDDGRWVVSFMHLDLGHYDCRSKVFNAFEPEPANEMPHDVA
jgi:hypothetical protein